MIKLKCPNFKIIKREGRKQDKEGHYVYLINYLLSTFGGIVVKIRETQRRKETDLFFKGFIFPKEAGIKFWLFLLKHKTKTYSDFDDSDILIYECLQYPVSSQKPGIMSSSFICLFICSLFICFLNAHYMCYIYLIEFTPSWEEAITSPYRLAFGGRVHVASAQ